MELDWITLYDYMSIFSRVEIKSKINKFYESFYPLKFKRTGKKSCELKPIERAGFLGIIWTYIRECLFALQIYFEAEYFLSEGKIKQDIKLSRMFIEIEKKNLEMSLELEKTVYVITEANKFYNDISDDNSQVKSKQKQRENASEKGFLEIKAICSLVRLFQFFYSLQKMKPYLQEEGFNKIEKNLNLFIKKMCQKSINHIKLYPEIGQILILIFKFFELEEKEEFNFHSHLSENSQGKKQTFPERIKKLIAVIPNKQKSILVNLNDEAFVDYLTKSSFTVQKESVENYFRCEEEINSIIAEEQNFRQSIMISELYRGKPEWKEKVIEQLVNLSIGDQKSEASGKLSKLLNARNFRLCEDFPLELN